MNDAKSRVLAYKKDIIRDIQELIRVKSVRGEETQAFPFGEGPANALGKALDLGERQGFKTVNLDNYAGYIEIGKGEEVIGVIAHVDVVPEGIGWTHDPYGGEIADGRIYGRGASDNKGPFVLALYALKILQDMGINLTKRIRLVAGANEESGMKCAAHYRKAEGDFDAGFAPDARFPLVFGEKGGYGGVFSSPLACESGDVCLKDIYGGEAANVVAPYCTAVLTGPPDVLSSVRDAFADFIHREGAGAESALQEDTLTITARGRAAHSSTPELGLNAISLMSRFLAGKLEHPFFAAYKKLFDMETNGVSAGCACCDEYGELTLNIGKIYVENASICALIDIRYPVKIDFAPYAKVMEENMHKEGLATSQTRISNSAFVDPASPCAGVLYDAYSSVSGDEQTRPKTSGGGTYAKRFPGLVAFGSEFPGEKCNIHMADEFIDINRMLMAAEIYIKALIGLNALDLRNQ